MWGLRDTCCYISTLFSNLRDNFRKAPFVTFHETDWRRVKEEKRKRKGRHHEADSLALCSPLFAGPEAFLSEISNTQRSLFLYFFYQSYPVDLWSPFHIVYVFQISNEVLSIYSLSLALCLWNGHRVFSCRVYILACKTYSSQSWPSR